MAGKDLDALAKGLAEEQISRGTALKRVGATLLGGLLASIPVAAFAAPRTCVTCQCGTGNPCNVKESTCAEVRAFQSDIEACTSACSKKNFDFCGQFTASHCRPGTCPPA